MITIIALREFDIPASVKTDTRPASDGFKGTQIYALTTDKQEGVYGYLPTKIMIDDNLKNIILEHSLPAQFEENFSMRAGSGGKGLVATISGLKFIKEVKI